MTILQEDGVIFITTNTTEFNTVDKQMYMYAVKIINFHNMVCVEKHFSATALVIL